MNKIFRFSGFAVLSAVFAAGAATSTFAQDACSDVDGQTAQYNKFTELYPKTDVAGRKAAIEAAKQFLEKYGACETVKEQVEYFKTAVPKLEELVKKQEEGAAMSALFARYDAGIKSDNADEVYAAGKEILAKQPENLNIIVPMGVIGGFQSSTANNFKYADDGIRYANLALTKLKSGAPLTKKNAAGVPTVGALKFEFTKQEAMDYLTYSLAYLTYYGKKDKKTALPLYYELAQSSTTYKEEPRLYATLGAYYIEESDPIRKEIVDLITKQKAATTDEEKEKLEVDIKAKVALLNGYTERALDAFSRAYKFADEKIPAEKTLKADVYKTIQGLYERRFDKKEGVDPWIQAAVAKPLPNPTTEVTPVTDPEPAKTTSSTATPAPAAVVPAATKAAAAPAGGKTATTATGKTGTAKPKR